MQSKVVVSGMGIISALGKGVSEQYAALRMERHGLSHLEYLDTVHAHSFPFGEIKITNEDLAKTLHYPPDKIYTRNSLLGIFALKEALQQSGIKVDGTLRIGLINATTVGGMCEVEKYYFDILEKPGNYAKYADTIDCADCTHKIADFFGIDDYVTTISTACSSASNAIMLGARMIKANYLDVAICGGTDALTKFTINGFNALKNIDKSACRPFDRDRNGLNLGEGAAYLVLERDTQCYQRNAKPLASLSGYCNFNESFHPTAPNPEGEGAFQAMKHALELAELSTEAIDYINAHGTATLTNDESESNALKRLFNKVPSFSSTKCYTGHTLAASGAVEAVYSILALQHQCVFANLNFQTPIESIGLIPQKHFEEKKVCHVMSNSFAFGGNNASLIFSKINTP